MQVTLHRTPRWRDAALEQIRIVGLGLRREMQVAAIVIGIVTVLVTIDIVRHDASTWFDSADWTPIALASLLLPFAVWRREKPFRPAFLWTLPVDRRQLALARVLGGWVWLMIALVVFFVQQSVLAMISRLPNAETVALTMFVGSTAMYLFGSALVIGLRHPLRWLFGGAGAAFLLGMFNQILSEEGYGLNPFLESRRFASAVDRGLSLIFVLWLGAGAIALWAAVSRQSENRHH